MLYTIVNSAPTAPFLQLSLDPMSTYYRTINQVLLAQPLPECNTEQNQHVASPLSRNGYKTQIKVKTRKGNLKPLKLCNMAAE